MSQRSSHHAPHPMSADTYRNLPTPLADAPYLDTESSPALDTRPPSHTHSHAQSLAERIAERQRQRSVEVVNEHLNSRANSRAASDYHGGEIAGLRDLSRRSSQKSFFQPPKSSSVAGQYSEMHPLVQRRMSLNIQQAGPDHQTMHFMDQPRQQTSVLQAPPQLNVTAAQGQHIIDMERPSKATHKFVRAVENVVKLHPKSINLEVQKYKYPLSFKMVATAIKNFLTQQKIVMTAIAPGRIKKRFTFDWARFRTWVNVTKPFEKEKEAQKMYELQAPPTNSAPQELLIQQQQAAEILQERQLNLIQQQFDPDLYPEHVGGRFTTQRYEQYPGEPPRSSRSSKYGRYLDVEGQDRYNAYTRSHEGGFTERSQGRRSPRFEFYGQEGRHSPYRRESRSRTHSHSQERRREMGPYDDWFEYQARDRPDPQRTSRDYDSGYERTSHDGKYSRDHGFYESESDYAEEYEEVCSDDYESPPYYRQENRRSRQQTSQYRNQGGEYLPASPHHFQDSGSPRRSQVRYKGENVRDHRERSPEDRHQQKMKTRGFDTDFGIYGGPGAKPPPLTLKEFNREQRMRKKKKKKPGRRSALYNMLDQDVDYPPELPPALKTLATYGKMFHGQLLQDAIQTDPPGRQGPPAWMATSHLRVLLTLCFCLSFYLDSDTALFGMEHFHVHYVTLSQVFFGRIFQLN